MKKPATALWKKTEIRQLAKRINELASEAAMVYLPEVDDIILSKCKDKHRIETLLDGILGICWDKTMLGLFKKLCKYYYDIDPRATVEYVHIYRDMWDEESLAKGSGVRRIKNVK